MPITNVRLDEVPATWIARLVPHSPPPVRSRMLNGGYKSHQHEKGWSYELQSGDGELASEESYVELTTAYDAALTAGIVNLKYVDQDGSEVSVDCVWDEQIAAAIRWGNQAERFAFTLFEAASGVYTRTPESSS